MTDLSDLPCGSCAHMAQLFDNGRVLCHFAIPLVTDESEDENDEE